MLYRFDENKWNVVSRGRADWPMWSADGKAILYRSGDQLVETRVEDGRTERLVIVKKEEFGGYSHAFGTTPEGAPIRTMNRDGRQVYEVLLQ